MCSFCFEKSDIYPGSLKKVIPGSTQHALECPKGFDTLIQDSFRLQNAFWKHGGYKQNCKHSG